MRIKNALIVATLGALVIAGASPAAAVPGGGKGSEPASGVQHCPDGGDWTAKIDTVGDPDTIEYHAPDGYVVVETCVKAGLTTQYDSYQPGQAAVTLDHREKDSISHWSVRLEPVTVTEPDPEPEPEITPEKPQDQTQYGDWTESWDCDSEYVTLERTFTSTTWTWDGEEWSPSASSGVQLDTRALTDDEIAQCEDEPKEPEGPTDPEGPSEPRDPDLDGTVAGAYCDADAAYLKYDIVINDPDGAYVGDNTATITFVNPQGTDWATTVKVGSGMTLWPGVTIDKNGKATGWPGWAYDEATQSWVDTGDSNYGWTRAELVTVEIEVMAKKSFTVTYPKANPDCASAPTRVVVVSDDVLVKTPVTLPVKTPVVAPAGVSTEAPAATPVAAEATYTG